MKQSAHSPIRKTPFVAIIAVLALAPLSGCGGSSSPALKAPATGRALSITFPWPTRSQPGRALPPTTQSVSVRVQDAQGFQDQRVVNRPADVTDTFGTVQFFALSDGTAQVQAQAFSAPDATGQILAESGQNVSLSRNQTGSATLTFNTAYTNIIVQTETPGASLTLLQGGTLRLVARGTSADGTIVEPSPAGSFTSSSTSVARVDTTGLVTTVGPGIATITFVDSSGRAGFVDLTVRGGDAEVIIQ